MSSVEKPIARRRLTDAIIDRLIAMIAGGGLKAGDRLPPEPALMKQFGVGRSSLREAINALSLIGLLSVSPGRGTHVTSSAGEMPSRPFRWGALLAWQDRIQEIIEARASLELAIVDLAVERATEQDLAELRSHLENQMKSGKNRRTLIAADLAFHAALARASHNSILAGFFEDLRQPIMAWMEQKATLSGGYANVTEQHERILRAIEARDPRKARAALIEHLTAAGERLAAAMLASASKGKRQRRS